MFKKLCLFYKQNSVESLVKNDMYVFGFIPSVIDLKNLKIVLKKYISYLLNLRNVVNTANCHRQVETVFAF